MKDMSDAIKAGGIKASDQAAQQTEQHIIEQLWRRGEGKIGWCCKDRTPPRPCSKDAIANDRGNQCRDNRLDLQVVPIEDFGGQDCSSQWSAKDGTNARSHASSQR